MYYETYHRRTQGTNVKYTRNILWVRLISPTLKFSGNRRKSQSVFARAYGFCSMAMSSMWPLIKMIQVRRRMRKSTTGISRPTYFIWAMLIRPRKDLIKVTALMGSSHAINSHFAHWLESRICMAHENLSDVVKAVIPMEGDFFFIHIFHRWRVIGKS